MLHAGDSGSEEKRRHAKVRRLQTSSVYEHQSVAANAVMNGKAGRESGDCRA